MSLYFTSVVASYMCITHIVVKAIPAGDFGELVVS